MSVHLFNVRIVHCVQDGVFIRNSCNRRQCCRSVTSGAHSSGKRCHLLWKYSDALKWQMSLINQNWWLLTYWCTLTSLRMCEHCPVACIQSIGHIMWYIFSEFFGLLCFYKMARFIYWFAAYLPFQFSATFLATQDIASKYAFVDMQLIWALDVDNIHILFDCTCTNTHTHTRIRN